jgi:hypothetical protein
LVATGSEIVPYDKQAAKRAGKRKLAHTKKHSKKRDKKDSESSDSDSSSNSSSNKRKKRSKKKTSVSSSSDCPTTESDSPDSSGSGPSSSSSGHQYSDAETGKKDKTDKKTRDKERVDWHLLNLAWPLEDRPSWLRKKKNVRGRDIDALVRLKREVVGEEEKKELGDSVGCRDAVVRRTKYKASKDDGYKKLHPARAARQPLAVPSKWYGKLVPIKRTVIVRNFPLEQYGAGGQVADKTLGKMHNRAVAVPFEHFCRQISITGKDTEPTIGQLEEAAHNHVAVVHALWPQDYSALALHRVLFEAKFGEATGIDDKRRAKLVRLFATDVLKANAARAVYKQQPLEYEQVNICLSFKKYRNAN